jgi:hypothetical protein
MRVYNISRWAFYAICLLILALPVSRHWKLLFRGETSTGEVLQYERVIVESRLGDKQAEYASTIEFDHQGVTRTTRGPLNYEYREGRTLKVRYDPADPSHNCILTFSGLYLCNYSIIPLFLLTVWGAFYLSFNNYVKRTRSTGKRGLARSPYRPFGKRVETEGTPRQKPDHIRRITAKDL